MGVETRRVVAATVHRLYNHTGVGGGVGWGGVGEKGLGWESIVGTPRWKKRSTSSSGSHQQQRHRQEGTAEVAAAAAAAARQAGCQAGDPNCTWRPRPAALDVRGLPGLPKSHAPPDQPSPRMPPRPCSDGERPPERCCADAAGPPLAPAHRCPAQECVPRVPAGGNAPPAVSCQPLSLPPPLPAPLSFQDERCAATTAGAEPHRAPLLTSRLIPQPTTTCPAGMRVGAAVQPGTELFLIGWGTSAFTPTIGQDDDGTPLIEQKTVDPHVLQEVSE